ncbi:MarR family protein [compost metagenome]
MDEKNLNSLNTEMMTLIRRSAIDKKLGGLDRSSYTLLDHLAGCPQLGVKALAERLGLDSSTISRQTAVLEAKSCIERVPDQLDGRASNFRITALGRETLEQAREIRLRRYGQLFEDWSAAECRMFTDMLSKLNRKLGE